MTSLRDHGRGSTGSLSSASTPKTHSCTRRSGSSLRALPASSRLEWSRARMNDGFSDHVFETPTLRYFESKSLSDRLSLTSEIDGLLGHVDRHTVFGSGDASRELRNEAIDRAVVIDHQDFANAMIAGQSRTRRNDATQ